MKKIALLALSLLLIITIFGCHKTDTEKLKESPVSDFEYELSSKGDEVYIIRYIGTSENVVIPSKINDIPVTSLRGNDVPSGDITVVEGVFEQTSVKTVTIPASIRIIGLKAFKDCKQLTDVKISKDSNLDSIVYKSFEGCTALTSIDFSSTNLSVLGGSTFRDCTNLKTIFLSKCLLTIESLAFEGCSSLESIQLPDTIKTIEDKAFNGCSSLESIQLPKNLDKLGIEAIINCDSLKKITFSANVDLVHLKGFAIYNVPSLEQIIFDEGREAIEGYALFNTKNHVEIIIPKSVKKFDPRTFYISGSAKLKFLGDCPEVVDIDGFSGELTICYDPNTEGWDNCEWKNQYAIELIQ